ncbi:hypothetical protein L1049_026466 [Liquidambar formosana]|uniref:Uncharacterized protein n=1 Tax=Liquidambar formosana TaxID=63359 RepID=A0AAP0NDD6_LIQFO
MALPASTVSLSRFQIKFFKDQPCRFHKHTLLSACHQTSRPCSMKITMAQFSEPNKLKIQINIVRERLWEAIPDSFKDLPWKNTEDVMLQRLLFVGKKALKWSLIGLFILSSLSDVVFSISKNKELMIPIGLFAGCMMTDFLKETSQELFPNSEERGLSWHLVGISCFFVLVKFVSAYFALQGQLFLLHVANGGLMQVLWLWRNILQERDKGNVETASTDMGADD